MAIFSLLPPTWDQSPPYLNTSWNDSWFMTADHGNECAPIPESEYTKEKSSIGFFMRCPWNYRTLDLWHPQTTQKTAQTIEADIVGTLFTGLISKEPHPELPEHLQSKIKTLAEKLAST